MPRAVRNADAAPSAAGRSIPGRGATTCKCVSLRPEPRGLWSMGSSSATLILSLPSLRRSNLLQAMANYRTDAAVPAVSDPPSAETAWDDVQVLAEPTRRAVFAAVRAAHQ